MIGILGRITFLIGAVAVIVALAACSSEEGEPLAQMESAAGSGARANGGDISGRSPLQPAQPAPAAPAPQATPITAPPPQEPIVVEVVKEVIKEVEVVVEKEVVKEITVQSQMMMYAPEQQQSASEGFNTIGGSSTVNDSAYD